jgi:hypothetical protein
VSFDLSSIDHTNYREVLNYITKNQRYFENENNRIHREEAKNHLAKHNIKVGMWFQMKSTVDTPSGKPLVYLYELQVKKINRTCIEATGFQLLPASHQYTDLYPMNVRIIDVIP